MVWTAVKIAVLFADTYVQRILRYNPVAFYDAGASRRWQDSARTIPAMADADVAGAWDDLSGNGYHVTQATTANKPTLRFNVINGRPSIRFDGADDVLVNSDVDAHFSGDDQPLTAIAVVQSTPDAVGRRLWALRGTGGVPVFMFGASNAANYFAFRRDDGNVAKSNGVAGRTANPEILSNVFTGSLLSFYQNGSPLFENFDLDVGISTYLNLNIGSLVAGSQPWIDEIATLIFFESALSAVDRAAIETILNIHYRGIF